MSVTPAGAFVIQKHAARRLHYDFRLELDGVLLSWAVPKGPSLDPADKRMAVRVEDHPLDYRNFEGRIPAGHYGAGQVLVWDRGSWIAVGDPHAGLQEGKLVFELRGEKLQGRWELIRIAKPEERQDAWLLFKKRDSYARKKDDFDVVTAMPNRVGPAPAPVASSTDPSTDPSIGSPIAPGARKGPMPRQIKPQLATAAGSLPQAAGWRFEIKLDGYRLMARIVDGVPTLLTRNGLDWSERMPELVTALATLRVDTAWLDGEIVVLDASGRPDFQALQRAFELPQERGRIVYFAFDLCYLEGYDLREATLLDRRRLLEGLLAHHESDCLRLSAQFDADPASLLASARRAGLEGLIAKRAVARYQSRRTDDWLKLKCHLRQEFVIGGYTLRAGAPAEIGSLLLGLYDAEGILQPAGSVGTGWDAADAKRLRTTLSRLARRTSPFARATKLARTAPSTLAARPAGRARRTPSSSPTNGTEVHWVKASLVAEIRFAEWTAQGRIRHAAFLGLRADGAARDVRRERDEPLHSPAPLQDGITGGASTTHRARLPDLAGQRVTHGERIIDPTTRVTKLALARYYASVADRMLPHLAGRAVSLLRAPDGLSGATFFQKHALHPPAAPGSGRRPRAKAPDQESQPSKEAGDSAIVLDSAQSLIAAVQQNAIEFHTGNATLQAAGRPNRLILDLDPGEGVAWPKVRQAALLIRGLLEELELKSWLKTSGGKGLHIVLPLTPRADVEAVRGFSGAIAHHLEAALGSLFCATSGPANRVGRIYVDYLRNSAGATTVAAYSVRARPGLGVSMPIDWDALEAISGGDHFTVLNASEHLSFETTDSWLGFWTHRQSIGQAMRRLDRSRR